MSCEDGRGIFWNITEMLGVYTRAYITGRLRSLRPIFIFIPIDVYSLPREAYEKPSDIYHRVYTNTDGLNVVTVLHVAILQRLICILLFNTHYYYPHGKNSCSACKCNTYYTWTMNKYKDTRAQHCQILRCHRFFLIGLIHKLFSFFFYKYADWFWSTFNKIY